VADLTLAANPMAGQLTVEVNPMVVDLTAANLMVEAGTNNG
jgi:hypothetical protein